MRLKSALEDFEANTLDAVSGPLNKLSYVGRLQDGEGVYEHWGLTKVYGGDAAQRAIRAAHRALVSDVLTQPLALLLKDVLATCSIEDPAQKELLASISRALPKPLSPGARAHLKAVLSALSGLLESRNNANPPGA